MDEVNAGGNIFLDIPYTSMEFLGLNASDGADIMLQGKLSADASFEGGLILTRSRICNLQGVLIPIYLRNTTSVDVYRNTEVGQILVDTSAVLYRARIINNGTIGTVNLVGIAQLRTANAYSNPKIYIENHGTLTNPILLPGDSVP